MAEYITKEQAIQSLNAKINFTIVSDLDFSLYKREMQEFANQITEAQEKEIKALPTEDVAPVIHAKWIIEMWINKEHYICSNCNHVINFEPCYHYCPMCGAKMDQE